MLDGEMDDEDKMPGRRCIVFPHIFGHIIYTPCLAKGQSLLLLLHLLLLVRLLLLQLLLPLLLLLLSTEQFSTVQEQGQNVVFA